MVEADELGRIAARERAVRPIEGFILACGVVLALACFLVFDRVGDVREVQDSGIERGYKNRAVTCDLQLGVGLQESRECADPAIQQYRDAQIRPASSAFATNARLTQRAVCELIRHLSVHDGLPVPSDCAS